MKRINPLPIDDKQIAKILANNTDLASHPELLNNIGLVIQNYQNYEEHSGNHLAFSPVKLKQCLADALKSHYRNHNSKDLNRLKFIEEIRNTLSPDICPMCGSLSTTFTVDHMLPQVHYPEFTIFSKNLVPACNCNQKKGTKVSTQPGERFLHPYYDDCLNDRLFTCEYKGNVDLPAINLRIINQAHALRPVIEFHLENLLERTNIHNWLDAKWSNSVRQPNNTISNLSRYTKYTFDEFKGCIEEMLVSKDDEYQTPNNWMSIFLHGLLNHKRQINYLCAMHNKNI